jgi:light-regulated signal transduction histidine kinase (bacteriophytochrome)
MVQAAQNMEALIAGLLHYSKFGEKQDRELVPLNVLVQNVMLALRAPIEETGAQVVCGELPEVEANPTQLQQLFQNLIDNALKYRGANRPQIEINAERQENFWLISVADNGIGIPAEYLDGVFLPMKRLHGHEISGTGLGLAVCKRIVETYEGRIWVESTVGGGSTFYFTLPRVRKSSITRA